MKTIGKLLCCMAFIMVAQGAFSQSLTKFFDKRGVYVLCQMAHPANEYLDGSYTVDPGSVDVSITSRDNVLGGAVYTDLTLIRGKGDLYISDILVQRDTDPFARPFDALKMEMEIALAMYKSLLGEKEFNKILASVQETFNTDITKWTGKMWAVFGMNLEYYMYLMGK